MGAADPARAQLLEVVHRAVHHLPDREDLPRGQQPEPKGQIVGDDRRGLAFTGRVSGDSAAAAFRLQTRRLHLHQHPGHRHVRVAPVHHQLGAGTRGHHLAAHPRCGPLDQQVVRVLRVGAAPVAVHFRGRRLRRSAGDKVREAPEDGQLGQGAGQKDLGHDDPRRLLGLILGGRDDVEAREQEGRLLRSGHRGRQQQQQQQQQQHGGLRDREVDQVEDAEADGERDRVGQVGRGAKERRIERETATVSIHETETDNNHLQAARRYVTDLRPGELHLSYLLFWTRSFSN